MILRRALPLLLVPRLARAQGAAARVGFLHPRLSPVVEPLRLAAVREGLGQAGRPVELVPRVADGTTALLAAQAAELVAMAPVAILAVAPPGVAAVRAATQSVPIIAVDLESDPVATGWARSLGRPGGNVTGLFFDLADFVAKCLELLTEAVPRLARLAVLWDPATGPFQHAALDAAARRRNVAVTVTQTSRLEEVAPAIAATAQAGAQALLLLSSPLFAANTPAVAAAALQARLPAITLFPEFAEHGGLLAYGPDLQAMFRRAGAMARRVVEGAPVGTLPIERPARFRLVANLRTARALGLELPTLLVARADEVIE